jgi:predicted O-methyltransferase YrrM
VTRHVSSELPAPTPMIARTVCLGVVAGSLVTAVGCTFAVWRWEAGVIASSATLAAALTVLVLRAQRVVLRAIHDARTDAEYAWQQLEALQSIAKVLPIRAPLLPLGDSRISADAASVLIGLILERKPSIIYELGSGSSTLLMAYACDLLCDQSHKCRIISIDNDSYYLQCTCELLAAHGLEAHVELRHAPLEPTCGAGGSELSYRMDILKDVPGHSIDLLLVDGPQVSMAPQGRLLAVRALHNALAPQSMVVWDDARRDRWIIERVAESVSASTVRWLDTEKGTALMELPSSSTGNDLRI